MDAEKLVRTLAERFANKTRHCFEPKCSCHLGRVADWVRELAPVRALIESAYQAKGRLHVMVQDSAFSEAERGYMKLVESELADALAQLEATGKEEAMTLRRYGQWAGDPKGQLEDVECCVVEVWPSSSYGGWQPYQCQRRRGYGPRGEYCKQHANKLPKNPLNKEQP